MFLEFNESHYALNHARVVQGPDSKYHIKKLMMKTTLYSVYLVSAKDQAVANDEVLLVEHPPAKEPSAHLLPVKINESATTSTISKEIVEAVHAHFAQQD